MDTKRMRASIQDWPEPGEEVILECLDEIERLRTALEKVGGWDCQGDSLRNVYDIEYGEGSWQALLGVPSSAEACAIDGAVRANLGD